MQVAAWLRLAGASTARKFRVPRLRWPGPALAPDALAGRLLLASGPRPGSLSPARWANAKAPGERPWQQVLELTGLPLGRSAHHNVTVPLCRCLAAAPALQRLPLGLEETVGQTVKRRTARVTKALGRLLLAGSSLGLLCADLKTARRLQIEETKRVRWAGADPAIPRPLGLLVAEVLLWRGQ